MSAAIWVVLLVALAGASAALVLVAVADLRRAAPRVIDADEWERIYLDDARIDAVGEYDAALLSIIGGAPIMTSGLPEPTPDVQVSGVPGRVVAKCWMPYGHSGDETAHWHELQTSYPTVVSALTAAMLYSRAFRVRT